MRYLERLLIASGILVEIDLLEGRTLSLLAGLWKRLPSYAMRNSVKRLLVSGDQIVEFEGNDHELRAAMSRLAGRTRKCVTVAVVVGRYHRRGCLTRRGGGYDPVGN